MEIPTILPPGSPWSGNGPLGLPRGDDLDREDFLLMLVTQLSNQDPMSPLEGHEFASQLAQFSSLEQMTNLNDTLKGQGEMLNLLAETMGESLQAQADMLTVLSESMDRSAAISMIGQAAEVPGDKVEWDGETEVPLSFEMEAPAEHLVIKIKNEHGQTIRTVGRNNWDAGLNEYTWDGRDDGGTHVEPGVYTFEVEAVDAEENPVEVTTLMRGTVERVSFGPDGILLWVHGDPIAMKEVRSILAPPKEPAVEEEVEPVPGDSLEPLPYPEGKTELSALDLALLRNYPF